METVFIGRATTSSNIVFSVKVRRRIVRVGTHTGHDNLKTRLYSHFRGKNQRSSIFRRNIGRVYLNKDNKNYLPIWNSSRNNKSSTLRYIQELLGHRSSKTTEIYTHLEVLATYESR